jgi:AcrR family transcriptional regulator
LTASTHNPIWQDAGVTTTRDALVEAATALLEEGGVAAVTLREVGRRAGVSHNAPYKHFADKEDLLASVAARDLRHRQAALRRARSGQPAVEVVAQRLRGFVRHALDHPQLFRLTYGPWRTGSPELGAAAEASRSAFVELVTQAQDAGDLPAGDPERVTGLLMALARGASEMALSGHLSRDGKGHADPTDLVDDLLAYLRKA